MPINRNAFIRYQTLDKCFRNFSKRYYFDDLLEEVNSVLLDLEPDSTGIQIRQLRDDIRFMKSEAGYDAPIEAIRDGRKAYYRYEHKDFSINQSPLNDDEVEQLMSAVHMLKRFDGAPQFEWLTEIGALLEDRFGAKSNEATVIDFDSNYYYKGKEHISMLYQAIVNQQVLKILYQPFDKDAIAFEFHPYYLKQYNNRWFVFGLHHELGIVTWNVPLDRIEQLDEVGTKYIQNETDWMEYFDDFVGVTKPVGSELEKVEIRFSAEQAKYIQTKPIHPSQKERIDENGNLIVQLEVIVNYELTKQILSYGASAEVLTPNSLRETLKKEVNKLMQNYQ